MATASRVTGLFRTALLRAAGRRGFDLSQVDRLPESLGWPLRRNGMLPSARLGELRAEEPVSRLTSFFGMDVWLVTGMTEPPSTWPPRSPSRCRSRSSASCWGCRWRSARRSGPSAAQGSTCPEEERGR